MVRKVSHIVTKEKPLGDKRFRRIIWTSKNMPLFTLVQFSGMEELSVPLIHGNSKTNQKPRPFLAPSLARVIEASPMKATALTESLVRNAGASEVQQVTKTPHSKRQVKQLQYNFRKKEKPVDQYEELFRMSNEYSFIRLFTVAPRLLLVSTY